MSHKVNLVRVLTAATGNSSPIQLDAAYSQLFMTPAEAGAMNGRVYSYLIVDGNNWEYGRGVYTSSGTTLARNVIASRIGGTLGTSRINLTGTAQVRFVELAEDMDGVRGTRAVTGTSDTLVNSDQGYVVTYSNSSAIAVSLAQAGSSGLFLDGWATTVKNKNSGIVTVTPATSTIAGASSLKVYPAQSAFIWSDGTNYDCVVYGDTTKFDVHGADVASASTLNLEAATGDLVDVTGTTTITAITLSDGHERTVRFTGALTLTHGASLVLPGGQNILTVAGAFAVFRGYASGVVRCVDYAPSKGNLGADPQTISAGDQAQLRLNMGVSVGVPDVIAEDQKSTGTNGGGSTASTFTTRDLNTLVRNRGSIASLSINQLTLGAGTYYFQWSAPSYFSGAHRASLYNVDDAVFVGHGTNEYSSALATDASSSRSFGSALVTIAGTKSFTVRHIVANSKSVNGFGPAVNLGSSTEVYARLEVTKLV